MRQKGGGQPTEMGFTLLDLLMVIVILSLLAAIVLLAVVGITDHGQTAACRTDATTLSSAEESYFAQNLRYGQMTDLNPKYIDRPSTLHSITVGSGSYILTGLNPCT